MKKKLIFGLSSLMLGTAFTPGAIGIVAHADEIESYEVQDTQESAINDVEKNELWIEMEKEVYATAQRTALLTPEAETAKMEYLLKKYDGAAAYSATAGLGQRIQNGGWNMFYNTAAGKQKARSGFNLMYVGWSGSGGSAAIAAGWSAAVPGLGWGAAAVFGVVAGANKHFAGLSKTCRDKIDANGNVGTARITITEARWSAKYDARW